MNPNSNVCTKSLNEWFDVNDELCFNPCPEAQLAQGTMMEAIDKNIPSDIIFVFDYSFDEEYSSESSSFQEDSTTFGSSTQYPTVCRRRFGNNTHTHYVVTPLSKEQPCLDKKSMQTVKVPVIKEVQVKGRAKIYRDECHDEGVELIYGSKSYLKKIGMRQRFIPLRRIRTMMTNSINQAIQLQGSGDSTKSLSSSDEESNEGLDKKDDVTEWKTDAKKKLKEKKQSEKLLEKQLMNAQRQHEKDQKVEAKRAKREARKNKGKDSTHFCSALKNLYGRRNVDECNVQHGISVQEVWRST